MMNPSNSQGWLQRIEALGNRLPHPTLLFVWFALGTIILSWLLQWIGFSAVHPVTQQTIVVENLVSQSGLHKILQNTVSNFTQFAPVGTVLVAMLGLGIAERSGLLGTVLKRWVGQRSGFGLTLIVVFAGIMSSLAADAGYVVLIPLAGIVFAAAGKHPLAGMAAAFAGVSGGFSANLLVGPIDAMLAGISTEAVKLVEPGRQVNVLSNYSFIAASTVLITVLCTVLTERVTLKRLPPWQKPTSDTETSTQETSTGSLSAKSLSPAEHKGLKVALLVLVGISILLLVGLVPGTGVLRDPETGSITRSPFISGIVTLIAITAAACGIGFGLCTGHYRNRSQIVRDMEDTLATLASYLVLMFFAAQFVSYFAWSNIGLILAVKGATLLQSLPVPPVVLMLAFILLTASINLAIGSASAKWSVLAPVFVPMFLLAGIAPEAVQAAYRVGDSSTNIITPLMPYFGVVVAFMQRYQANIGVGTIIALMLPYSLVLLAGWSLMFAFWYVSGVPFGVY